jgi:hypothetical protein
MGACYAVPEVEVCSRRATGFDLGTFPIVPFSESRAREFRLTVPLYQWSACIAAPPMSEMGLGRDRQLQQILNPTRGIWCATILPGKPGPKPRRNEPQNPS